MTRAVSVATPNRGDQAKLRDTLLLDYHQRRAPAGTAIGLRGTAVEFALPPGTRLRQDDRVILDDGGAVEIVARPEPLLEIRAGDTATLARAAWLFGDHHIPVEVHARYLRVLQTAAAEDLIRTLSVSARRIEAPFEPEGGAYDQAGESGA
jgi:urease accessory protein